jgi:hypothetical protein
MDAGPQRRSVDCPPESSGAGNRQAWSEAGEREILFSFVSITAVVVLVYRFINPLHNPRHAPFNPEDATMHR